MQLLVSVADAFEARAALAGGADVIDAKDPAAGALGAVSIRALREIRAAVCETRPMTAAIGEASDETAVERLAYEFASAGVTLLKVGFSGIDNASHVSALLDAALRGAAAATNSLCGIVAVGYADADPSANIRLSTLIEQAASAKAWGVLLDTVDKSGPGLRQLMPASALTRWVEEAHEAGLVVALAGKLTADDLAFAREAGADIAGVRGAACDNGRTSSVAEDRVRLLRSACEQPLSVMWRSVSRAGMSRSPR